MSLDPLMLKLSIGKSSLFIPTPLVIVSVKSASRVYDCMLAFRFEIVCKL